MSTSSMSIHTLLIPISSAEEETGRRAPRHTCLILLILWGHLPSGYWSVPVPSLYTPSQFFLNSRASSGPWLSLPRSIQEEEAGEEKKSGFDVSECHLEQLELINSTQACRVLVDPQGPFAACHQTVAPEPFQE